MGDKLNTGTYCLITRLKYKKDIKIGKKPSRRFPAGFYVYVGSAMNNMDKRIGRHLSHDKKFHWHIDRFLEQAVIVQIVRLESSVRTECVISKEIERLSDNFIIPGFGSSDCRCNTHLHYFKNLPGMITEQLPYPSIKRIDIQNV